MSTEVQTVQTEVIPGTGIALAGTVSENDLRARMAQMKTMIELKKKFLSDNLRDGIDKDYAVIPGTQKNSLLKPGAEKLLDWHGYYATFELVAQKEDWDIGLFAYTYRCVIKQKGTNMTLCDCEGDCSTYETKYRVEWKYLSGVPRGTDPETLTTKTVGYEDNAKIKYGVPTNGCDKRNTVRKMAQKRALIGATVLATATSDLFSADEPDDDDGAGTTGTTATTGATANAKDDGWKKLIKGRMKSKYGDDEKPSKCAYCGNFHVKIDDDIVITEDGGKKLYGSESCLIKRYAAEHPAAPEEKQTQVEAKPADPAPTAQPESTHSDPTAKLSAHHIRSLTMAINDSGKTEKQFLQFLETFNPAYKGKGINDILIKDFDDVMSAWDKALAGGKV